MPYKLMIKSQDGLLTGAELEAKLIELGFTVPEIQPYEPERYPEKTYTIPVREAGETYDQWIQRYLAYRQEKNAWEQSCVPISIENNARRDAYLAQFTDFAQELDYIFDMTVRVQDGLTSTGQKNYKYVEGGGYTFLQAAQKLIGYACIRPLDPINFICYKYFG